MRRQRIGMQGFSGIQVPAVLQVMASWFDPSGPRHPLESMAEIVAVVGFIVGALVLAVTRDWHAARGAAGSVGGVVAVVLALGWFGRGLLRGGFGRLQ